MTRPALSSWSPVTAQQQVFRYGSWSILFHLGLLMLLGLTYQARTTEKPVPVVNVRLLKTETLPSLKSRAESPPPLKQTKRILTAQAPSPASQLPALSQVITRPASAAIQPPPLASSPKPLLRPRKILQDTKAADALAMQNFLKVAQAPAKSSPSEHPTSLAAPQVPGLPAASAIPDAPIPAIHTQSMASTAEQRLDTETFPRRLLVAVPPAVAGAGRSKVGLGRTIPPVYPLVAREQGWEGTVRLRVVVNPDGHAEDITVHQTSGHEVLDEAAVKAVRSWQFIPARDGNIPIQSIVEIPINFDLRHQG